MKLDERIQVYMDENFTGRRLLKETERGSVWLASDKAGRPVIIKHIQRTGLPYRKLKELSHPLWPGIRFVSESGTDTWVVEEYVSGKNLKDFKEDGNFLTKSEVRSVCLSKLRLRKDSVCYDIGAGTGSVSVEMARLAVDGRVYSVEKKEEAVQLLRENKKRFRTDNLEIISGEAPEALESLPAPSHAFIGGSSGSLSAIIELLLQKNPEIRIVITCITLETLTECTQILKEKDFQDTEIVQVGVTKAREAGNYHLMQSENPVWIISFSGRGGAGEEEEVRSGAGA